MISLDEGAAKVVRVCARVKPDERVVVLTDDGRPREIAEALLRAVRAIGAEGLIAKMPAEGPPGGEPPDELLPILADADVVLTPTTRVMFHSLAAHAIADRGGRVLTLTLCGPTTLMQGAIEADFEALEDRCLRVAQQLSEARAIEIATAAGTALTASIAGRAASANTAVLRSPGSIQGCPTIEAFIAPVEDSAEGTIVIDGSTSYGLVDAPVVIKVSRGRAVSIDGGATATQIMDALEATGTATARTVAEIALGLNPAAKVVGNLIEDEGSYGTGHFALGRNVTFGGTSDALIHIDMVYHRPTVWLDGRQVFADGTIVG